ncbi:heavy metal-associated isoprenylated plant protein 16-like [Apium graveolens]|uniref:heavy metal-associated isoprenylated plant protein 16-like n=1 Tax=Apium graveolens TaxID=4045 RepID=UPI003D7A6774
MKQKVVIKVAMCSPQKSRVKAMKIAATSYGVEAVALKGDDKDQIEVIGEGIDTIELAKSLRKYHELLMILAWPDEPYCMMLMMMMMMLMMLFNFRLLFDLLHKVIETIARH